MSSSSSFSCGTPMRRAETGSFPGLAAVFLFFTAFGGTTFASPTGGESWLNVAVQLGIVVIPIGSIVPAGSLTCVIISGHFGLPIGFGVGAALALGFSELVTGATSVAIIVP